MFYKWEEGQYALQMKDFIRTNIGIDPETRHFAALATYAEAYNGLGTTYTKEWSLHMSTRHKSLFTGKYISDGSFLLVRRPTTWHRFLLERWMGQMRHRV